ncbi:MAG: MBL fold metallo-hydrolase, partial [Chloroflexota bacterium]
FLGTHNLESATSRLVCLLIDGVIAVDAGSLTSGLTFEEQREVKAILLSHHHFDHIRDLNTFGLASAYSSTTPVYAPQPVLEALTKHFFQGELYPDFLHFPQERPALKLCHVEPFKKASILDYTVVPLPVPHSTFAYGYEVTSPQGRKLFYSGDTGPGLASIWEHISPHLIIAEVTASNKFEDTICRNGHLSPNLLHQELRSFKQLKGFLPPVVLLHFNPRLREEIRGEVMAIAQDLDAQITLAQDGMRLKI